MSTEGDKVTARKFNDMVAKLNFVKDGAIKLPPGFRFQPTDQEIVFQYLLRKTISCPLPATIIPEFFDLSLYNPCDLPGNLEQDRYFFSKKLDANGNKGGGINRTSGGGYWKATGVDKQISRTTIRCHDNFSSSNSIRRGIDIVGMKKTLVFCNAAGHRTLWIMHEYRLLHSLNPSNTQKSWVQMGNWVLCHIFLKKRNYRVVRDYEELATNKVGLAQQKRLCEFMISTDDYEVTSTNLTSSSCSSSSSSSPSFLDSSTEDVSSNGINM